MNYGFKEDAKSCVASTGRCGSTIMTEYLIKKTKEDDVFGVHARDFVEFNGKVIFLFGNPMNTVISTHRRIPNLELHYEHMGGDYPMRAFRFIRDTLGIEKLFDDWYRKHNFKLMTVRYETMWENLNKIGYFFDLDFSDFPKKRKRLTDWRKHPNKVEIRKTYSRLNSKIESARDIAIW